MQEEKTSAISRDETSVWREEPLDISVESGLEKIHARPATLFRAASVWQMIVSVIGGGARGALL